MHLVATCSRGTEAVLGAELAELGIARARPAHAAVWFEGPLESAYRVALWSRVASRVLLALRTFSCADARALYEGARAVRWQDHLGPAHTLAVDFVGSSRAIRNSRFGALKVKDAIVDALRDATGARPSIDLRAPDVRVVCHLADGHATLSVDLCGPPLFLRGLERDGGPAPLKETLAATILRLAGWPAVAARGGGLVDPMCGSGTLLTEAAGMAAGIAPGLARPRWGFERWRGHQAATWERLLDEARGRPTRPLPPMVGIDLDRRQVDRARANLRRAGFRIHVRQGRMEQSRPPEGPPGIVVTNPPYGERLDPADLVGTYRALGDLLRRHYLGWTGWILAGSPRLARQFGLKPARKIPLFNGRIDCRLVELPIATQPVARRRPRAARPAGAPGPQPSEEGGPGGS